MNLMKYFSDARAELSRVSWPSREQVVEGTQAVLIFVIALTLIVWLMDVVFGWGIHQALK
ncbi:protein translocase subunit SecE [Deinococcus xinjiangensis]|uniref:Protein translocase subunit SecE n=1 Tax=Deinococcus xinjiangensis TaxID=457454 RepID=A0ABP9V8K5_9DEIO